jgi:hypothetical protein
MWEVVFAERRRAPGGRQCTEQAHLLPQRRGPEVRRGAVVEDGRRDAPILAQLRLHGAAHAQVRAPAAAPVALEALGQLHLFRRMRAKKILRSA